MLKFTEKIQKEDFENWLEMGLLLWPRYSKEKLKKVFQDILKSKKETVIICKENSNYIGFINLSLRFEHVSGAKTRPVAYVEGIFVKDQHRKQGIAKQLLAAGEKWAKSRKCAEIASDVEFKNKISQNFHKKIGFKESNTLVHFIKAVSRKY
jgi:aminoglycoside 6'-N-acetyltransferase I